MTSRYLDLPCRDLDQVLRERTAITADQPDAFAAGGRQDGDATILALFAEWQTATRAYCEIEDEKDPEYERLMERSDDIEQEIYLLAASGAAGIAIKVYLRSLMDYPNRDGRLFFDRHNYEGGRLYDDARCLRSLLADAARFVPELAPFVAEAIAAPLMLREGDDEQ